MNILRTVVVLLAFSFIPTQAQEMLELLPEPGNITMTQYDQIEDTILNHPDAEIILQDPSVTQISIESEYTVCFIPDENHPAYPGIACRYVEVGPTGCIKVETLGWSANPDNAEFQPWLSLFIVQDHILEDEIIDNTRSSDENT
jgi:hypothetical protein